MDTSILNNLATAIVIINKDTSISFVNKRFTELTGYSEKDAVGKSWTSFVLKEDLAKTVKYHKMRRQKGKKAPNSYEFRYFNKKGEVKWAYMRISMLDGERSLASVIDVTEIKQQSEKVVQNEEKFRRLFETAQDGILLLNADTGKIEEVNPYLISMLGYTKDQIIGKQVWEISPFADIASNKSKFRELVKKGYVHYEDLPLQSKKGELKNVEFVSNSYSIAGKKVIQCNIRDISTRVKAERLLDAEKKWSQKIIDYAPDLIVGLGEKSKIMLFNKFAEKLTGYKAEEVMGKRWIEVFIPKKMRKQLYGVWDEIVKTRAVKHHYTNPIITREGEERLISWHNSVLGKNGNFKAVLSIGEDITETKLISDLLKTERDVGLAVASSQTAKEAFDKTLAVITKIEGIDSGAIYLLNDDGGLDMVSHAGFGEEFVRNTQHYGKNSRNARIVARGKPFYGTFRAVKKRGLIAREGIKFLGILPIHYGGKPVAALTIAFHFSKQVPKQTKKLIEEMSRDLSIFIMKAKNDEKIQELIKMKSEFIRYASHELKTPLTTIMLSSEMLKDECKKAEKQSPRSKELLAMLGRSSNELDRLIDKMLEFEKTQEEEKKCVITRTNIKKLVEECVNYLDPLFEANRLVVIIKSPQKAPIIRTDAEKIKAVVNNFMTNAAKFDKKGPVTVEIKENKKDIIISVKDNGIGFTKEEKNKVFEAFHKARPECKGSGVGLSICKKIIEDHGGTVRAESDGPGKGATFSFSLPKQ